MAKIYLIRHCESEGNACRRTQAQFDALVTAKGYQQNEMLRRRFQNIPIDAIYSSDSFRSIMTADPIAKERKLPIRVRMCLREVTTGVWEDEAWGNIARDYPAESAVWNATPWLHTIPAATSYQQVSDRVIFGLRRIAREVGNGTALCVSHSVAIKAALCVAMEKPFDCVGEVGHGDNTAVSLLDIDSAGNITVDYVNDDTHLPGYLRRAWNGVAGSDVNLRVDPCDPEKDRDVLLAFAERDFHLHSGADAVFDSDRYWKELLELLKRQPAYVALSYLHDEPCGFVRMQESMNLPQSCGLVDAMYMQEKLCGMGYTEQLFGYAAHGFRYAGKSEIVLPKPINSEERRVATRFMITEMKGFPEYISMWLHTPPCPYPVLA